MITLPDPQIFSKNSLYTTMRVRGAWNEGKWGKEQNHGRA